MVRKRAAQKVAAASAAICALIVVAVVGANAPTGRYEVNAETIYDTKTKLTWQRLSSADMMTQSNAIAHCLNLSLDGAPWRLPTVKELSSLIDVSSSAPAIDSAFNSASSTELWSASPVAGPPNSGWSVDFEFGSVYPSNATDLNHARCVR